MPKLHEIIVNQMLDDEWFRSAMNEALAKAGIEVTIPGRAIVEPAIPYATPPQPLLEASSWRMLTADELIQDGDQWAPLKEPDRWRPVGDSVGTRPSNWTKSHFRRMVGVEQMAVTERRIPGDGHHDGGYSRIVDWHRIRECVGRLLWVKDNGVIAGGHRELGIIKIVNMCESITIMTMSGEKRITTPFELFTLDHDEQWMIGMQCEMGDITWEERNIAGLYRILDRINGNDVYRFDGSWSFCRINETYYRSLIEDACRQPHATEHRAPSGDDAVAVSVSDTCTIGDVDKLVWIGGYDDRQLAIFRGFEVETGLMKFDTLLGGVRGNAFTRISDAPKSWLSGYRCFVGDNIERIMSRMNDFVISFDDSREFRFRVGSAGFMFAELHEEYHINKINDAMARIADRERDLAEAPF